MAFDSFRDFVNALDKAGELKRISQPVATKLEIADREMKSPVGGKALLFEKPTVTASSRRFSWPSTRSPAQTRRHPHGKLQPPLAVTAA